MGWVTQMYVRKARDGPKATRKIKSVIASVAKQSSAAAALDCFATLAMTAICVAINESLLSQCSQQDQPTPAKAGVHGAARQLHPAWIPAFAGMTAEYSSPQPEPHRR